MFSIALTPSYWWPVTVSIPQDGGARTEATFEVEYLRHDEDQYKDFLLRARASKKTDRDLAPEMVKGFRNVVDGNGAHLAYNEANLALLLNVPGVAGAIVRTYFKSRDEAATGNS